MNDLDAMIARAEEIMAGGWDQPPPYIEPPPLPPPLDRPRVETPAEKRCAICHEVKAAAMFGTGNYPGKLHSYCRPCMKLYTQRRKEEHQQRHPQVVEPPRTPASPPSPPRYPREELVIAALIRGAVGCGFRRTHEDALAPGTHIGWLLDGRERVPLPCADDADGWFDPQQAVHEACFAPATL